MPAVFKLIKDGVMEARIRIKKTINGVPTVLLHQRQYITGLKISEAEWKRYNSIINPNTRQRFLEEHEYFDKDLKKIEAIGKKMNEAGLSLTPDMLRTIIHDVMYADVIKEAQQLKEEKEQKRLEREEAKRKKEQMTLVKFIDLYVKDIKEGNKTTLQYGRTYAKGSRMGTANALEHFKEFMKDTGVTYDFQDVDIECYSRYKAWLMNKDINSDKNEGKRRNDLKREAKEKKEAMHYSDNTIGRFIKQLKAVLRAADTRGYPVNPAYKSIEFKGQVQEIDAIYLTRAELEAMEKADLSDMDDKKNYELARDIFMIGVWLAQRVSDYNNLRPENIKVIDNGGEQMTFVSIHQQKTGRYVEIPCNAKIRAILDKYPEGLPHLSDQKINLYIKDIGKKAKIDDLIEIKETRGGEVTKRYYKKYDLICTHTARRTGATLMYLDGIPIYDIMKVTGHKSVTTLEKYIRADKLEVAQKLVLQYDYFK